MAVGGRWWIGPGAGSMGRLGVRGADRWCHLVSVLCYLREHGADAFVVLPQTTVWRSVGIRRCACFAGRWVIGLGGAGVLICLRRFRPVPLVLVLHLASAEPRRARPSSSLPRVELPSSPGPLLPPSAAPCFGSSSSGLLPPPSAARCVGRVVPVSASSSQPPPPPREAPAAMNSPGGDPACRREFVRATAARSADVAARDQDLGRRAVVAVFSGDSRTSNEGGLKMTKHYTKLTSKEGLSSNVIQIHTSMCDSIEKHKNTIRYLAKLLI